MGLITGARRSNKKRKRNLQDVGYHNAVGRELIPRKNYIERNKESITAIIFASYVIGAVWWLFVVNTIASIVLIAYHIIALVSLHFIPDEREYPPLIGVAVVVPLTIEVLLAMGIVHVASVILYTIVGRYEEVGIIADRKKKIRQIAKKPWYEKLYSTLKRR